MIALPILAIALIAARLGIFLHLHVAHREFSPLRNTVSDYGTGRTRPEFTLMAALSMPAYAFVLITCSLTGMGPTWALIAGGIGVLAGAVMPLLPTDLTGTKLTATGVTHWALAIIQFAGLFVAMTNLVLPADASPLVFEIITWIVRITFYAFLVTLILPKLRRSVMGLAERLFVTATALWFMTVAAYLIALG